VGRATFQALCDARLRLGDRMLTHIVARPMRGDDVITLQDRLLELGYDAGRADGIFGPQTETALRSFQRDYGLFVDGVCGPATHLALRQLQPKVRGGRPVFLREQERVRRSGPALRGKRIVIDPSHGGPDRGVVAGSAVEADLMWDLARRLGGRMAATGMETLLSRGAGNSPSEPDRAAFANTAGADVVLSLHTDGHRSALAQGLATFHFGTGNGLTSTVGEALAAFIQRELAQVAPTLVADAVILVDYDPAWPAIFEAEAARLRATLGTIALRVDHVGSTSVPGLMAKAIIDIQVSVASFEPLDAYRGPLEEHDAEGSVRCGRMMRPSLRRSPSSGGAVGAGHTSCRWVPALPPRGGADRGREEGVQKMGGVRREPVGRVCPLQAGSGLRRGGGGAGGKQLEGIPAVRRLQDSRPVARIAGIIGLAGADVNRPDGVVRINGN